VRAADLLGARRTLAHRSPDAGSLSAGLSSGEHASFELFNQRTAPADGRSMIWDACLEPVTSSRPALAPLRRAVATAPMRVSFAGGGTDLPPFLPEIGGRVVGTAVDLRVRAVVEPFDRGWVSLELPAMAKSEKRRRGAPRLREIALRLLEATLAEAGMDDGVLLRVETDVVPGAGLGGSGAAAVAALAAILGSIGDLPAGEELARQALRVERDRLRLACGPQDPIFAALGGMQDLRFDAAGAVARSPLPENIALTEALGAGMLLVDTGQRRVSGEVLDRAAPRADVTAEMVAAAGDVVRGFASGSLDQVLTGMRRSAAAKIRRDPVANAMAVELARALSPHGVEVVRMCGAGGGGHVLVWAPPDRHEAITSALGATVRRPALGAPGVRLEAD
jgi:D-glycero-alpha-D-manno-heptose-7-phosphate kinase